MSDKLPPPPKKLSDFEWVIEKVFCISNTEYQYRNWVNHEDPGIVDSYDDTTMYFLEDAEAVIEAHLEGRVEMSEAELKSLKELYEKVDAYDDLRDRPDVDAEIVKDPRWIEITKFANKVYDIISTDEAI